MRFAVKTSMAQGLNTRKRVCKVDRAADNGSHHDVRISEADKSLDYGRSVGTLCENVKGAKN
jgi:hypothetical protein